MRFYLFALSASLLVLAVSVLSAGADVPSPAPINLWNGPAPGALGNADKDIPTITPYIPARAVATRAAMLVIPGGGYWGVVTAHEGTAYAEWLNQQGIAAFVLKYRVAADGYHLPAETDDGARAMRYIRANAAQWNIDPHRIGVMGSSAGGHMAAVLVTLFDSGNPQAPDPIDRVSDRPDIGVICYGVISMGPFAHQGSRDNLLGPNPSPELVNKYSAQQQVSPNTPPCFIWATWEDQTVPVENTLMFADALRKNNVKFDLHIYEQGAHGIGLGDDTPPFLHTHPWVADFLVWLKVQGFLTKPTS